MGAGGGDWNAPGRREPSYPVPIHLRNAPTKLMREMGFGAEYKYPPAFPGGVVEQAYLPPEMLGVRFYGERANYGAGPSTSGC